ncbi:hypothetical protein BBP40_005415 [Aspergillus hancockii]|nr:hypothetical protein BBP40_005415 [Aspergillus hancockii]
MELAPSQQPPETKASTESGLLHPEATFPGLSHTSNDLDGPAVVQEQLASEGLQGQVAPVPHQDGQDPRAEKVVTRINFEDWPRPIVQEEHETSSMPAPEPPTTTGPRAETASPGDQPTTVLAGSSPAVTPRIARRILKPRIVVRPARGVRRTPSKPNPNLQAVTINFRAQEGDRRWKTVHELQVNPSDPSEVERVARKDARDRNATFYDKNLRQLTPAQCFKAAIEDETSTIFMKFEGELVMDEETMVSIARDIEL